MSKPLISHGAGVRAFSSDGSDFIDCSSGTFNLSLGYSHPEVMKIIRDQSQKLIHCSTRLRNTTVEALEAKLAELSPIPGAKVYLKIGGGSEANEGAIKMAQYVTGRTDIVTFWRSHLGQTIYMMGLSGNAFRQSPFQFPSVNSVKVPPPYCRRCFYGGIRPSCGFLCGSKVEDFVKFSSNGRIAAVLLEPIFGNGDNIVCPPEFANEVRRVARQNGAALIYDEIQTGIGRTGTMFATQWLGGDPDLLTIAKGLGGSGAQIAAIIGKPEYMDMPINHHAFTYGGNILACAVALRTLEIIGAPQFLSDVRAIGDYLRTGLEDLARRYEFCDEIRGVGLMLGLEIVDRSGEPSADLTNYISEKAFEHGLIIRTSRYGHGNVLKFRPR